MTDTYSLTDEQLADELEAAAAELDSVEHIDVRAEQKDGGPRTEIRELEIAEDHDDSCVFNQITEAVLDAFDSLVADGFRNDPRASH